MLPITVVYVWPNSALVLSFVALRSIRLSRRHQAIFQQPRLNPSRKSIYHGRQVLVFLKSRKIVHGDSLIFVHVLSSVLQTRVADCLQAVQNNLALHSLHHNKPNWSSYLFIQTEQPFFFLVAFAKCRCAGSIRQFSDDVTSQWRTSQAATTCEWSNSSYCGHIERLGLECCVFNRNHYTKQNAQPITISLYLAFHACNIACSTLHTVSIVSEALKEKLMI